MEVWRLVAIGRLGRRLREMVAQVLILYKDDGVRSKALVAMEGRERTWIFFR